MLNGLADYPWEFTKLKKLKDILKGPHTCDHTAIYESFPHKSTIRIK